MGAAGFCAASAISGISAGCKKSADKTGSIPTKNRAQAAAAATPCSGATPFSIILHGLHFVELWDGNTPSEQRVRVISPKCAGMTVPHVHRAGSWKTRNFTDISGSSSPGWPNGSATSPDISGLPTFKGMAGKVRHSKIHHSLDLPWPDRIIPLRKVSPNEVNTGGILTNASVFPLSLALTYQCGAPADLPPINGPDWSKDFNFHIFCEPECKVCNPRCGDPCESLKVHAREINSCINDCFDNLPDFKLEPKTWACKEQLQDDPPANSHIDKEEEGSLSEIHPCPTAALNLQLFSVHLPLCASLILTP
jgi:hypothetical protein